MRKVVKKIGFSFYPEDLENLESIAKDIGMSKTEVMRQLIKKAVGDKKTREIIAKNSFWEKVNKQKKLSSYNVQYENDASNHMDAPAVSSNSYHNDSEWDEDIARAIEIAQARWAD